MFDEYLKKRAEKSAGPFVPFDIETDYAKYVDGKPRYDGVRSFLHARGIDLHYEFQTADNGAVHAMVANGMGVAVMPRLAVDPDDPAVAIRALEPPIPARQVVIARREGEPGPLTAAVVETALAVVEEMGLRTD